jgi:c-di-GMP-binding flagellar brake protein YcgR
MLVKFLRNKTIQQKKWGNMKNDTPKKPDSIQKRKHDREQVVTEVSYQILTPAGDMGLTQNISEGGLCLLLNNELSPGTVLQVQFTLPDEKAKKVKSFVEVIWQSKTEKGFLTGVKFLT